MAATYPPEQSGSLNTQDKITAVRDAEPNAVFLENFCTYFMARVKCAALIPCYLYIGRIKTFESNPELL